MFKLDRPCTQEEWINNTINDSDKLNLNESLDSIPNNLTLEQIMDALSNNTKKDSIYSALSVLMTIYNRFKDRMADFDCLPGKKTEFCIVYSKLHQFQRV